MINSDIGTDIHSDWELNEFGDLKLASDEENIKQIINNRLTADLNEFPLFYNNFGSVLFNMFGDKADDSTLELMRIEVENTLVQDPRFNDFDVNIEYKGEGVVEIRIRLNIGDMDYEMNYILDGTDLQLVDTENNVGS